MPEGAGLSCYLCRLAGLPGKIYSKKGFSNDFFIMDSHVIDLGRSFHNAPFVSPDVLNVTVVTGAGALLWWISQKMKAPERIAGKTPLGLGGRLLNLSGLCLLALGLYAGFAGPVNIGSFALGPFPFANFMQKSSAEADAYVRANIQISSRPAAAWKGGSKTTLECIVQNNGDRRIGCLYIRLNTASGKTADFRLDGPFPARQRKSGFLPLPDSVSRSYFTGEGVQLGNVTGAKF
jgi:hypothetical protein